MFHAIIGICTGRKDAATRAVPVEDDDRSDVRAYLETMVGKGDTVALLAVSRWKSAAVDQEIQRVEDLAQPESVQRLQLDLDEGGREGLARLRRDEEFIIGDAEVATMSATTSATTGRPRSFSAPTPDISYPS